MIFLNIYISFLKTTFFVTGGQVDENLLKIRLLSNQPNDFTVNEGESEKNVHLVVQEVRILNV